MEYMESLFSGYLRDEIPKSLIRTTIYQLLRALQYCYTLNIRPARIQVIIQYFF